MSDRCEPPPKWRGEEGWHWLRTPTLPPTLCKWREASGREGEWAWHFENGSTISAAAIEVCCWTYLGPVPTPEQFTALVKAARLFMDAAEQVDEDNLKDTSSIWEHSSAGAIDAGYLRALRAALAPFGERGND